MSDAITNPSDMFVPELAMEYLGYEFRDNLGILQGLVGTGPESPIRLRNFGFLQRGGQYVQAPRFKQISSLEARRDITSNSAIDTQKLAAANDKGVICNRRVGPVALTPDAALLAGLSVGALEQEFASQAAQAIRVTLQKLIVAALKGAAISVTPDSHVTSVYNYTTPVNLSTALLAQGRTVLGDGAAALVALITHSNSWYDLTAAQVASTAAGIGSRVGDGGAPFTLGMLAAICDISHLRVANGTYDKKMYTLLLRPGAIEIEFVGAPRFYDPTRALDQEQVQIQLRGDWDVILRVPGMQWDSTNGGANPTEANLATSGYWDPTYSDHREVGVGVIEHNSSLDLTEA